MDDSQYYKELENLQYNHDRQRDCMVAYHNKVLIDLIQVVLPLIKDEHTKRIFEAHCSILIQGIERLHDAGKAICDLQNSWFSQRGDIRSTKEDVCL